MLTIFLLHTLLKGSTLLSWTGLQCPGYLWLTAYLDSSVTTLFSKIFLFSFLSFLNYQFSISKYLKSLPFFVPFRSLFFCILKNENLLDDSNYVKIFPPHVTNQHQVNSNYLIWAWLTGLSGMFTSC